MLCRGALRDFPKLHLNLCWRHESTDRSPTRSADRARLLDHEPRRRRPRFPRRAPAQPARCACCASRCRGHGAGARRRLRRYLFQSAAHARQAADRYRQSRRLGHQDYDGAAAAVRIYPRRARLRSDRQGRGAGFDQAGYRRAARHPRQSADAGQGHDADVGCDGHLRHQGRDAEARRAIYCSPHRPATSAA